MLDRYRTNRGLIYGVLNFCYQNEKLDVPLRYIRHYHSLLYGHYQRDHLISEPIKVLLANIAYFKLGDNALARKFANEILVENTHNISAMKLLYFTSEISHRQYYLE